MGGGGGGGGGGVGGGGSGGGGVDGHVHSNKQKMLQMCMTDIQGGYFLASLSTAAVAVYPLHTIKLLCGVTRQKGQLQHDWWK